MIRLTSLALACLLGLAAAASADEPAKQVEPWSAPEVQDVLYFSGTRPVLFRLHLYIDGKPFSVRWNEYFSQLFKYLDRDDNGVLDKIELSRMPGAQQLANLSQGMYQLGPNQGAPAFGDVDANSDGKVTFEEFVLYYQRNGIQPVRLNGAPGVNGQSAQLTNLLFSILDANKDGKLSRAELEAAPNVLRKFDQDDDELITAFELQNAGVSAPMNPLIPVLVVDPRTGQPQAVQTPFLLVPLEEAGRPLSNRLKTAKDLLARYDTDKDGKLTREELGFPKDLFAKLNPDKNGKVDATKLLRWLLILPDVELTFRLGKLTEKDLAVEIAEAPGQEGQPLPARKVANTTVAMTFGKTNLNLVRSENPYSSLTANNFQVYLQQFRMLDKDKKGFVTARQLETPQGAFLKQIMKLADRDEDDKLTEKELVEFNEVMTGSLEALTSLQFSDFGQGLFEMLDANRDGRLGVRELRTAWARLSKHDDDGDGCISKEELPRQCQLMVTRGGLNVGFNPQNVGQPGMQQQTGMVQAATSGPVWFRKMDVNHDGDVSPREFLGSPEDFARIDTDGDGLISVDEAIKADAWFREKIKPKP
jgi:Ca2+-binding EF-hand superfamily protein